MNKKYFCSIVVATLIFSSNLYAIPTNDIITPPPIQKSKTFMAPSEAIITFKKASDMEFFANYMSKMFSNFTHTDYSLINGMHISVPGNSFMDIKSIINALPILKNKINTIEPNYIIKPFSTNDSYYSKLWAIENNGQSVNGTKGTKDADMDVSEAWNIEKGEHSVVVAVVDTGVDYTHSDLEDNMWNGNAKHGYDFAGDDDGNNDDDPMPDTPYDENGHYHGTHVAGIIGAVGDNSSGISGVAQNVQIMAVKVFRPNGYAYSSDILEGLDYIAKQKDNGVNIVAVNASYGGEGGSSGDSVEKAIKKLGEKGIVFCAAAGNDSKNIDSEPIYPASYSASNIISIAATTQDDTLANFSNYGKNSVDVAAPGENILSTYPDNQYAYMQGTSMATPNVTGVVALLFSLKPDASVDEVVKAIIKNVDIKASLDGKVATSGRVNAYKALKSLNNSAPTANDDNITTEYETKVVIDVLSNDSDIDGDSLNLKSIDVAPQNGRAKIVNGKIEYTPNKGFSGEDSLEYSIDDGSSKTSSAKVTITVKQKPNSAPIAKDDTINTKEDTKITIDVLSNDSDKDGDTLSIKSTTTPQHGSVSIKNGKIEYTPSKNYNGKDYFKYTIDDGNGNKDSANVDINISAVNDMPLASNDKVTLNEDSSISIDVLKNDKDVDGDKLSIKITSKPQHGSVKIVNDKIKYTPKANYNGYDSFKYVVNDGKIDSNEAIVSIKVLEVNDAPTTKNDKATTNEDTSILIDVLKNDSDIDGDTLSIKSVTKPKNGTATIKNGKIEYTPNANFNGDDSFNYTITDNKGADSIGEVNIKIKPINDAPIANNDSVDVNYETKTVIDVLKNDSDIDEDALSLKSINVVPKNGIAKIVNNKIEYTPNKGFSGKDSLEYSIDDGNGASSKAKVDITVKEKPKNPPKAQDDRVTLKEDTKSIIDVLKNDSDIDGDTLSIKSVTKPNNGTIKIINNKIEYTPNANFNGEDSFEYIIEDPSGLEAKAKVNIKIEPINDTPTAKNDSVTLKEDNSILIDVLKNDSDIDGDKLDIKDITTPKNGTAIIENGKVKYIPKPNYNGEDSFKYTIVDPKGAKASATVKIDVLSINDAPIANNDSFTTKEDRGILVDVLNNDTDIDGDKLTIKSIVYATHGTVSIKNNKIEYIPNANFNGKDSFAYTISDGNGKEATANVNITVEPINDTPVVKDDKVELEEDSSILIDVLKNDIDIDGDKLKIKITSNPKNGIAIIENGKVKYTPKPNYNGEDSFKYVVNDGLTDSKEGIVKIKIKAVNDAPKAIDDTIKVNEDNSILIDAVKNDIDIDGDKLIIKSITNPKNGTAEIINNKIKYTPKANYNGEDSFYYTIIDNNNIQSQAKVIIKVQAINDAPKAIDDKVQTPYETKVIIDALKNDSDIDNDKLYIKSITKPQNGYAIIRDNKIEYTPNRGFSGEDKFKYTISDGKITKEATIYVEVLNDTNNYPPVKIDPIEKIIKLFSGMNALNQNAENRYLLDNGNGYIEIYEDKKEIKLEHKRTPFPKEPIGNIKDFKFKDGKIELTFSIDNSIEF
jgi:hypothetical protein